MDPIIRSLFIKIAAAIVVMSAVVAGLILAFEDTEALPAAQTSETATTADFTDTTTTTAPTTTAGSSASSATILMPPETTTTAYGGDHDYRVRCDDNDYDYCDDNDTGNDHNHNNASAATTQTEPEGLRAVHAELEPSGQIVLCYVSGRTTSYCTVWCTKRIRAGC